MDKYKSLVAWQHAHELAYRTLKALEGTSPSWTWALFDQARRAVISAEANLVEGYALSTTPQFRRHVRIALGSAAETQCLLQQISRLGYLPADTATELAVRVDKLLGVLFGLNRTLSQHPD